MATSIKYFILISLSFLFFTANAGKLDQGFAALKVHNYFEAKRLFEKSLKSDPTGASYGMSLIFSNAKNPFYHLDSALKYVIVAEVSFPLEKEKSKLKLKEFDIDTETINIHKTQIGNLAFQFAVETKTIQSCDHFINNYEYSDHLPLAVDLRDSIAFSDAERINSYTSYYNFMKTYTNSKLYRRANIRYETRLFEEKTADGLLNSYDKFIREYPKNPFVSQAMDSVYSLFITENTFENYYAFINNYPDNKNVSDAWRTLYKLYNKDYSKERIVEFRLDFPGYPFIDEVMMDYELSDMTFLPIKESGLWGFVNQHGNVMVKPIYDWVELFHDGLAMVGKDFKVGFINKAGTMIIPLNYDDAEQFNQGFSIVEKNEKYGLINKANLVEIPLIYDELNEFSHGLASVQIGEKYGYVDLKGSLVLEAKYDYAGDFENSFAYVEIEGKKGIIDKNGNEIVPLIFDWLENFSQGRSRVRMNGKYGLYDNKGRLLIPILYDHIGPIQSNRCLVVKDDKYTYFDSNGKMVIPF